MKWLPWIVGEDDGRWDAFCQLFASIGKRLLAATPRQGVDPCGRCGCDKSRHAGRHARGPCLVCPKCPKHMPQKTPKARERRRPKRLPARRV